MFNFGEKSMVEKIVIIGAGALTLTNTVVNTINTVAIKKQKKNTEEMFSEISSSLEKINKDIEKITGCYCNNCVDDNKEG